MGSKAASLTSPPFCIFSASRLTPQIIDDTKGVTLVSASTLDADLRANYGGNKEAAKAVGLSIAKKAYFSKENVSISGRAKLSPESL